MSWSNWSGSVRAPAHAQWPRTEDELAAIVGRARTVRPTGAGHSFMPLCASDDAIVSLEDLEGELTVDYGDKGKHVYRAGDALLEAINVRHNGQNTGSGPARPQCGARRCRRRYRRRASHAAHCSRR